jgi:hypothetical protein
VFMWRYSRLIEIIAFFIVKTRLDLGLRKSNTSGQRSRYTKHKNLQT